MKLSVIIPVYNEKQTILKIVRKVKAVDLEKEILIVDDCSTDGTREELKSLERDREIRIFYHDQNRGKGSAIRTALHHVQGDLVIVQDADLEYDPQDYVKLVRPIMEGKTEVVYGSRYLSKENILPFTKFKIGVLFLNWLVKVLYGFRTSDEATCYKVFKAELLKSLSLKCKKFEFCPEVTAKVLKRGHKIIELPISYRYRTVEEGKKIGWKDGLSAVLTLIRYRFFD
jgi:glycosyltransferase involved in cell wall biosynthesis